MTGEGRNVSPWVHHRISVTAPHRLSVKEYGAREGVPAVFLHGGPGSGCRPTLCRLFDLERFRVIAPDQRGAGDSTPKGCLENNTTQDLVADLETVREYFGIERWLVVGGSWGALLAVAYAEAWPERVSGIVLRSFFLGGSDDLLRAFVTLPQAIYPELYTAFIAHLPEDERAEPLTAYYRRILDPDPAISLPAAYVWHDYERALSELRPEVLPDLAASARAAFDKDRPRPATPRMEAHYFSHDCFLRPGQLLDAAGRLGDIPGVIVQSRYDLLCPAVASYALSRRWPRGLVRMVNGAGHSQSEAGVEDALVRAVKSIADTLQ